MTTSSWYRRNLWNYKGNKEYTKSGFVAAKERFDPDDLDVDCSDRHYVITGSNSGIGLEIAREIAKRGGVLHMVCRNIESAKAARSLLITTTGNDKIHLHTLDLSRPREVLEWARNFAATHEKIHVLINNAGCMVHERRIDGDGIETNFAVNTLSVHILIMHLLPVLQKNEDARVITVSSAGMLVVRLDPIDLMHEDMDPFNGALVYSQNKRQQVVMTLWYATRYDKVKFSVMHPGWVDTPAVRSSIPQFYEMMKDNLRAPSEGADTVVWLAISKAALKYPSGYFFQDREAASSHLPLAWTKTSIEEENLLMQKLMIWMEKISNKVSPEETISNGDNTTLIEAHIHGNGIKVPFESGIVEGANSPHSAVSMTKSEEAKLQETGDLVEQQSLVIQPSENQKGSLLEETSHDTENLKSRTPTLEEPNEDTKSEIQASEGNDAPKSDTPPIPEEATVEPKSDSPTPNEADAETPASEATEEQKLEAQALGEVNEEPKSDTPAPEATDDESKSETPTPKETNVEAKVETQAPEETDEEPPKTETPVPEETDEPKSETPAPEETNEEPTVEEPAPEETGESKLEMPAPANESKSEAPTPEETDEPKSETPTPEEKDEPKSETPAPEETEEESKAETPAPEETSEEPKAETPGLKKTEEETQSEILSSEETDEGHKDVKTTDMTSPEEMNEDDTGTVGAKKPKLETPIPNETEEKSESPAPQENVGESRTPAPGETEEEITEESQPASSSALVTDMLPDPTDKTYQSAASVVDHLIDVTARQAESKLS